MVMIMEKKVKNPYNFIYLKVPKKQINQHKDNFFILNNGKDAIYFILIIIPKKNKD